MKKITLIFAFIFSQHSMAIDFQTDIVNKWSELIVADSNGPSYRLDLVDYVEKQLVETEFYRSLEDGLNHEAIIECEPADVFEVMDADEVTDYLDYNYTLKSIKTKRNTRSIAYVVDVGFTFQFIYNVYKTEADANNDNSSVVEVECPMSVGERFVFENTKNKQVKFLGKI